MPPRLASNLLVSALIRRVGDEGGFGTVLARGDATSGAILLLLAERGVTISLVERSLGPDDAYLWRDTGPAAADDLPAYLNRRRARDPDLWIVELDVADAARLAAGLIG